MCCYIYCPKLPIHFLLCLSLISFLFQCREGSARGFGLRVSQSSEDQIPGLMIQLRATL